jgi:hypothetical protein
MEGNPHAACYDWREAPGVNPSKVFPILMGLLLLGVSLLPLVVVALDF